MAHGARWADNPLAVCERVLISLYTTDTVEEMLDRLADGLRPGQIGDELRIARFARASTV